MSRFLANLMERASQPTVAISPVLPSLFGAAGDAAGWMTMTTASVTPTSEELESTLPLERRNDERPQQAAERQMHMTEHHPAKPEPAEPLGRRDYVENEPVRNESSPAEIVGRELPARRENVAAKTDLNVISFTEQPAIPRKDHSTENPPSIAVGLQKSSPVVTARPVDNASVATTKRERPEPGTIDVGTVREAAVAPSLTYTHRTNTDLPAPPLRAQAEREDNPGDYVQEPKRPAALVFSAVPVTRALAQPRQQAAELRQSMRMTAANPRLPAPEKAGQEPPSIQVSIGRIEVRATPSPQRPPRTSDTAQPSLNEYLKKRSSRSHV
jgi:hypothetical protein